MSEQNPTVDQAPGAQRAPEIVVDDSAALPSYSNFCRVAATPEEVILDFGLNPQPFAAGRQVVKSSQRIVMSYFTAKRLLATLGMTVQRHEGSFGAVELDVNRRASGLHAVPLFPQAGEAPHEPPVIKLNR